MVSTATFAPLLFGTAFNVSSITLQRDYGEKREPVIWVNPRAVAEGSCQVLESLGIWVAPSFPKATWEVVVPVQLLLGAKHVPASVLHAAKILFTALSHSLSWAPPDCVNPVLKNMPPLKPQGTYVQIPEECCVTVLIWGRKPQYLSWIKSLFRLDKKKFECTTNTQC